MTTKEAIEHVLAGRRKPMRVPAIIEAGVPLATSLKGKTPGQTFYSVLYSESKKAAGLPFRRAAATSSSTRSAGDDRVEGLSRRRSADAHRAQRPARRRQG